MLQWMTTILLVTLVAVAAGFSLGQRHPGAGHGTRMRVWCFGILALLLVWYLSAKLARTYGDRDIPLWPLVEWWAHTGMWYAFMGATVLGMGFAAGSQPVPRGLWRSLSIVVALLVAIAGTAALTMPIYLTMKPCTQRNKNGLIQQSSRHTCAPTSLANYLERFAGRTNVSERDMARLSGTTIAGTTSSGLLRAARASGLRVVACRTMSMQEIEALNMPVIVSISTVPSVHHATLLWKFEGGNVHLFDPDYGYEVRSREWFQRVWYGKTIVLDAAAKQGW